MYLPIWEGPIEGYSKNYVAKRLFKLEPLGYEFCDLVQEAYLVFLKCKRMYEPENAKHFMSLYKTALRNKFFDLWYPKRSEPFLLVELEEIHESFSNIEQEGNFKILLRNVGP